MVRRTSAWVCVWLGFGCAAPEDKNPAIRCDLDSDCPGLQACYRGYCLGDDDGVVPDDAWSSSDDGGAGVVSTPPVVEVPKDAVATPSAQSDAGSASPTSAPVQTAPAPAPAPVAAAPAPTAPAGNSGTPAAMPAATTPSADAGAAPATPPAAQPPAAQPPASMPGKAPPPTAEPPAEAGSLLGALIEAGLAPSSMLVCVPSCLLVTQQRECERCIDRVIRKDRGENPCSEPEDDKPGEKDDEKDDDDKEDDERNTANDPLCAVWNCARGTCRGGA